MAGIDAHLGIVRGTSEYDLPPDAVNDPSVLGPQVAPRDDIDEDNYQDDSNPLMDVEHDDDAGDSAGRGPRPKLADKQRTQSEPYPPSMHEQMRRLMEGTGSSSSSVNVAPQNQVADATGSGAVGTATGVQQQHDSTTPAATPVDGTITTPP